MTEAFSFSLSPKTEARNTLRQGLLLCGPTLPQPTEKQAAIDLRQWTEKRDVKLDANVHAEAKMLAATFTLDELEQMMGTALKAVEAQSQQEEKPKQGAVLSAALPAAEAVIDVDAKTTESAEVDPDVPEWMR